MSTTFDDWLSALRAGGLLLDSIPPATRGLKWEEPVEVEGDWTGATLEGTVSVSPDAPTPLATMTVSGPVVASGVSTWLVSLAAGTGANSTGALPDDDAGAGYVELPCMFRLTPSGGDQATLRGGLFTVIGKA